jgi:hypothetical protein
MKTNETEVEAFEEVLDLRMAIEHRTYQDFMARFKAGHFGSQRLGQAFFNHFELHEKNAAENHRFNKLYELDGDSAQAELRKLFIFM